jgi:hypothetical protein
MGGTGYITNHIENENLGAPHNTGVQARAGAGRAGAHVAWCAAAVWVGWSAYTLLFLLCCAAHGELARGGGARRWRRTGPCSE